MGQNDIERLKRTRSSIQGELRRRRETIERNTVEEKRLEAELRALDAAIDRQQGSKRVRLHVARILSKGRVAVIAPIQGQAPKGCLV